MYEVTELANASVINNLLDSAKITDNSENFYKNIVKLDWDNIRTSKGKTNNTKWMSILFNIKGNGEFIQYQLFSPNEMHIGKIMAPLTSGSSDKESTPVKRSAHIRKYSREVQTEKEDRITVLKDDDGNPIYPSDEYLSVFYKFMTYLSHIFDLEYKKRCKFINIMMYINENATKNLDTKEEVTKLRSIIKHKKDNDTILQISEINTLKEKFKKNFEQLVKGFLVISNTKFITPDQKYVSENAETNAGKELSNPGVRPQILFNRQTGEAITTILDKTKEFRSNANKIGFKVALWEDKPINLETVSDFITSRSIIDIAFNVCICISQVGISMPAKLTSCLVKRASSSVYNLDALFEFINNNSPNVEKNDGNSSDSNSADGDDNDDAQSSSKYKDLL